MLKFAETSFCIRRELNWASLPAGEHYFYAALGLPNDKVFAKSSVVGVAPSVIKLR